MPASRSSPSLSLRSKTPAYRPRSRSSRKSSSTRPRPVRSGSSVPNPSRCVRTARPSRRRIATSPWWSGRLAPSMSTRAVRPQHDAGGRPPSPMTTAMDESPVPTCLDVLVISFWMSNIPMPLRLIPGDGSASTGVATTGWSMTYASSPLQAVPLPWGMWMPMGFPRLPSCWALGKTTPRAAPSGTLSPAGWPGLLRCPAPSRRRDPADQPEEPTICKAHQIALADVQMDGETDIIVGNEVFRSSDLARIAQPYNVDTTRPGYGGAVGLLGWGRTGRGRSRQ